MQMVSVAEPRLMAATVPSSTPKTNAKMMARMPTSKETVKDSPMMRVTGRFSFREIPKSPCRQLPRYIKYCIHTGLSRPYLAYRASMVA